MRIETDFDALAPVGELDVVDLGGRPLDAGIVDHDIEAPEVFQRIVEPRVDRALAAHIHMGRGDFRKVLAKDGECCLVDIADMNLGAIGGEGLGDSPADAIRRRRDHDPL